MKVTKKQLGVVSLGAVCVLSAVAGASILSYNNRPALAETTENVPSSVYFYDNLLDTDGKEYTLAKKFYDAFDDMNKSGDFKDGVIDYSLTEHGLATSDEIGDWVINGNLTIPKAFSAARDAYLTDHPELFYIDFYKMTISAARSKGVYTAYIDSGLEANLYQDGGFTSEADVNKAINTMNAEVEKIAGEAEKYAEADTYGTAKDILKARYVNNYLANNISYDYGALNDYLETGASSASAVYSSFGGLVNKKAVCSGYSRAYKVVMDKLGIPCLVVSGYSKAKDSKGEFSVGTTPHAWNYVWLEDPVVENYENDSQGSEAVYYALSGEAEANASWYAFDVTWNSTGNNKNRYMNMGSVSLEADHIIDGVISSSGYELKYPELALYDYGCKTDSNGLVRFIDYIPTGKQDDYGNELMQFEEKVSYNGKSAIKLAEEDNLHIIYRTADMEGGSLRWSVWIDLAEFYKFQFMLDPDTLNMLDDGVRTLTINYTSALYTQFAVIDSEPDINYNPLFTNSGYEGIPNMYYSYDYNVGGKDIGDHISVISEVFENKAYGTYVAPPYVAKTNATITEGIIINDSMRAPGSNLMDEKYAKVYEITYDEPLHILNDKEDIGISFTTKHSKGNIEKYAKLLPLESGKLVELVDEYTLKFKFMPSLMYEHNMESYTFSFTNIGSNKLQYKKDGSTYTSDKAPNTITFRYDRIIMACPKVFGYDGRLWIGCCAQPTLLSNSDLSEVDFKDEDGNIYSENERSQMLLVVDKVGQDTQDAMMNDLEKNNDINIKQSDIKKSETYDINLQICGKYRKIPNGSYVKIALGFPEGYGPEDEGVTFKLYHYKHDNEGNYLGVEEIPCVVTQLGIVATVTSFSPYMVAAVDSSKASDSKTVYASISTKGGKLSAEDGMIRSLKNGESYTYTIKPDEGYLVYRVMLNGVNVADKVSADGKLTVNFNDLLNNNEIEIQYISSEAAARFTDKQIERVDPVKVVVATDGSSSIAIPAGDLAINKLPINNNTTNSNTWIIVLTVILGVLVVAMAVTLTVVIIKRRKSGNQ